MSPTPILRLHSALFRHIQLFGSNASWLLAGFLGVQTYNYYRRGARDHLVFKFFVYLMVFITISQSATEGFLSYHNLVGGWGDTAVNDPRGLLRAFEVMSELQTVLIAPPALFVQLFFTWRIWTFCMAICGWKLRLLATTVCAFLILTSICAFGLALTFYGLHITPVAFPLALGISVITVSVMYFCQAPHNILHLGLVSLNSLCRCNHNCVHDGHSLPCKVKHIA